MTLDWQWNEHAYVAVSAPFVLVVHDNETSFDYYVWENGAAADGPAAFGTVYDLERAFAAAESALFTILAGRASNWALWVAYFERIGSGRERTTNPCNCRYCEMTEAEVEEYRRQIRRMHGERE